jgi:UDPglucose--hexose-1-phosphate uridylyltransferase
VRVVPNLYPALERQEVVIHVPQHARSVAELSVEDLAIVAEAWSARAAAARVEGFPYVQALLNEGREAGASRAHTHSQLVWFRDTPPVVLAESAEALPGFVHDERESGRRVIAERDGVVLLAAYAGRLPYELLIAPVDPDGESAFGSPLLAPALALLGEAVRRLHAVEGPLPLNAWLHDGRHWHIEVLPRLSVLAGLELGAGIYVNTLPPEEAATRLREA